MVEVLPFLINRFPNRVFEDKMAVDNDLLKVFGFDRLKGHGDPLDGWPVVPKLHIFELCGLGEVKGRHLRRVCTHRRRGIDRSQKLEETYPERNDKH